MVRANWRSLSVLVLVTLALSLGGVDTASAVEVIGADGSPAQPYQHWVDLSHVPTIDATFSIDSDLTACRAVVEIYACVIPSLNQIHIPGGSCGLFGPGAWRACRFILMHELGHAFELEMPDWKRWRFAPLVSSRYSWSDPYQAAQLREYFADVYAMCSMRSLEPPMDDFVIPDLSPRTFRRACHLIKIPNA